MNQGFLKLMVVQQLLAQPSTGYAIVKTVHEKTGWKPSWGSIYPLLSQLEEQSQVTCKSEGKRKVYTLTAQGKKELSSYIAQRDRAIKQIMEELTLLASLGDQECDMALRLMQAKQSGKVSIEEIPEANAVREQLIRLILDNKIKAKEKQIRAIMSRALVELQRL